jgi:hypothetical protein
MSFERILLAVLAAFVLLAGLGCLLAPSLFAQQAQFQTAPSALAEIRAFYGGLQLGIGLFLLWCLRTTSRTSQGLMLVGLAVGGAGLARIFGILIDHAPTSHHLANLGIEVVTVVLVAIALSRARRQPTVAAV